MNLRNFLTLTVQNIDFNLVAERPALLENLRKLTLNANSGMNYELNWMLNEVKYRKINCQVLLAYRFKDLIGWALLSKESSNFYFPMSYGFNSTDGWLFEVYVEPKSRKRGIASELYKTARSFIKEETLCVCPWDDQSERFYNKVASNEETKWI
jgi:GNAT superfamily N-acetyltransferase